ncbi:MAG: hypothetical protein KDE14_08340 [Rhodobacteraceae bacterium]|nr:hypothetical protein [Paracoccaceae bacterium]
MSDPITPRAQIGVERRRQMQIRGALMAGLKAERPDPAFLAVCSAYLVVSLTRLDFQDMEILVRLRDRVPTSETDAHNGLTTLDERQAKARAATAAFAREVERYRTGQSDAAAFVTDVRAFADLIQGMMAPRRNPYERYTNELFTDDDWAAIADATPEAVAEEKRLFAEVKSLATPEADPETMPTLHGGPPR